MSGSQVSLILIIAILSAAGYFTTSKILDYKKQAIIASQAQENEERVMLYFSNTIDKALEIINRHGVEPSGS